MKQPDKTDPATAPPADPATKPPRELTPLQVGLIGLAGSFCMILFYALLIAIDSWCR